MLSWHPSAHPGIILSQEEKLQHSREGVWPGEGTTLKAGSAQLRVNLGHSEAFTEKSMISFAPEGSFYPQKLPAYRLDQS